MTADPLHSRTFRIAPLGLIHAAAIGAGVLLGGGLAGLSSPDPATAATAAAFAAIVWILAAGLGLAILAVLTGARVDRLAFPLFAISFGRMLAAIMLAIALYVLLEPAGRAFWTCFLLAGLATLAAETAWAIKTLNPGPARLHVRPGHDGAP